MWICFLGLKSIRNHLKIMTLSTPIWYMVSQRLWVIWKPPYIGCQYYSKIVTILYVKKGNSFCDLRFLLKNRFLKSDGTKNCSKTLLTICVFTQIKCENIYPWEYIFHIYRFEENKLPSILSKTQMLKSLTSFRMFAKDFLKGNNSEDFILTLLRI